MKRFNLIVVVMVMLFVAAMLQTANAAEQVPYNSYTSSSSDEMLALVKKNLQRTNVANKNIVALNKTNKEIVRTNQELVKGQKNTETALVAVSANLGENNKKIDGISSKIDVVHQTFISETKSLGDKILQGFIFLGTLVILGLLVNVFCTKFLQKEIPAKAAELVEQQEAIEIPDVCGHKITYYPPVIDGERRSLHVPAKITKYSRGKSIPRTTFEGKTAAQRKSSVISTLTKYFNGAFDDENDLNASLQKEAIGRSIKTGELVIG